MKSTYHKVIVAGPCAVESETQILEMAHKISVIRDIAKPYGIEIKMRGGAWKPRTLLFEESNGHKKKVFEGLEEHGLKILATVADKYDLPLVVEIMSEKDLPLFEKHLKPKRDYLQIGSRNSQNFSLLYLVGTSKFGVVLKNPQHGTDPKEALGSIQRFIHNREIIYCMRGQKRPIVVEKTSTHNSFIQKLHEEKHQHKDARNLNNINSINQLKGKPGFENVTFAYDPSHTWGGKSDLMRQHIGKYALLALMEYGYGWIIVEVNDKSKLAKCDRDQALLTTTNGIDWKQTFVGKEPSKANLPFTLVDIVGKIMAFQLKNFSFDIKKDQKLLNEDVEKLHSIFWNLGV
jgi:3-deoxy-D-arabino-heptulosonate 7-phosphate (DAHP) synthase